MHLKMFADQQPLSVEAMVRKNLGLPADDMAGDDVLDEAHGRLTALRAKRAKGHKCTREDYESCMSPIARMMDIGEGWTSEREAAEGSNPSGARTSGRQAPVESYSNDDENDEAEFDDPAPGTGGP